MIPVTCNNKNKKLRVCILVDLEGHFKCYFEHNYSMQAAFLEEFPLMFE